MRPWREGQTLVYVSALIPLLVFFCRAASTVSFPALGMGKTLLVQDGAGEERPTHIRYTTVAGFFLQDDPATDPETFDYTKVNLGLINRTYPTDEAFDPEGRRTQWERFERYVDHLNEASGRRVEYKVLFFQRHGEGYHNVAEAHYGTEAWDCYWSLLDGDGTSVWADAEITGKGIAQARRAHEFWGRALAEEKIPAPQSYYSSPLQRCIQTAQVTFDGLNLPADRPFQLVIKELLRETLGIHTCDRRHPKSWIAARYPSVHFDPSFPELDPLWRPDARESASAQVARLARLLDDVIATDAGTWIALSAHSGAIRAALAAVGHREFALTTGSVVPVLLRAEVVAGRRGWVEEPPTGPPLCEGKMVEVMAKV